MEEYQFKVLVVDDTEANIDLLVEVLGEEYELSVAMDGEGALEAVEEEIPDIILLDIMMPGIDGYEVCKRLKANPLTCDIPVIFLTAKSEASDETKGIELGAVDYITKPISIPILLVRIRTHLQLKAEKSKLEELTRNLFPSSVTEEFKMTGKVSPVLIDKGAVIFSDLVGFNQISVNMKAEELLEELTDIFSAYDEIVSNNLCEKIKTIGDTYVTVSGIQNEGKSYADNAVRTAIEKINYLKDRAKHSKYPLKGSIGIDSGSVIGGIIGSENYLYDIFGSTVSIASKLQEATRIYDLEILISDKLYNNINNLEEFHIRKIDVIKVRSENEPITIYEVYDCDDDIIKLKKMNNQDLLLEAIATYQAGDLISSKEKFEICHNNCSEDTVPRIFLNRINKIIEKPISIDWDGVTNI